MSVFDDCVQLRYQVEIEGGSQLMDYPIKLAKQAVHLGGFRHWFICPICNRQSALLYCNNGVFACRQCQRLTYRVQCEKTYQRAIRKAEKLRAKLQWQGGLLTYSGDKPKWMHRRTFERLQFEAQISTLHGMKGLVARLDKINARYGD